MVQTGVRAVKKILQPFGEEYGKSGLFGFWLRFGSVTGFIKPAPSPKPRQNPKILAPNWLQYFLNRSSRFGGDHDGRFCADFIRAGAQDENRRGCFHAQ
ncbi:MAG TPA: hypothetical protein VN516_05055 [Candidatus Baltobacteraceae bacterium]|nr:hypothetical protein [Candidatus Baltobacteraceae bacterium]